ncbi:amidase family protein [Actinomadura sp. NTSP31]|uniref:amidase family protein n=1 Tax=Actinomadura sp. NTSP31 TaxID=1735447 RepID=UPI0035C01499
MSRTTPTPRWPRRSTRRCASSPGSAPRWWRDAPSTRLALARGALVTGADYVQAQRVRRVAQRALARLFDDVDLIAAPTLGIGAPRYADITDAAGDINMDATSRFFFTPYWDAVGNPVLAAPMGATAAGLPLSLQLAGPAFGEAGILRAADAYQRVTDWHLRVPPLATAQGDDR